jgi:ribosomal protein RSM22 (predicted rRNA methylase)
VTLPQALQAGIDEIARSVEPRQLERSARALSDAYRSGAPASRAARSAEEVASYLAVRAPATYAAAAEVCRQISLARPGWVPASVLDLGAGPGTASWAALESWPGIAAVTLVEAEPEMLRAGRTLAAHGRAALQQARWIDADAGAVGAQADLVIVSYLIGELEPAELDGVVRHAWAAALDTLVIIEPGTTAGYGRVIAARRVAIDRGASTLAPCPHDTPCPLPDGDWCHFATRLPRNRTHRVAKGAELGFEDEKFSYVALCRTPRQRPEARVIRRLDLRKGHVVVDVCTTSGLERRTVTRKEGDVYRRARKLRWGDAL